jgi:hypothetical protein
MNYLPPSTSKNNIRIISNFFNIRGEIRSQGAPLVSTITAVNFATGTAGVVDAHGKCANLK